MNDQPDRFVDRGGVWVVIQALLMIAVVALGVAFHGDWTSVPVIATGALLFLTGGYFGIAGAMVLGRNRTPYPLPRDGSELVQNGIYARLRHPLYTSVMLASFGWGLIWQSSASLLAALALVPFFHAKARREERWLCEKFPSYRDYAKRVPRFIPRLGPASQVCL